MGVVPIVVAGLRVAAGYWMLRLQIAVLLVAVALRVATELKIAMVL